MPPRTTKQQSEESMVSAVSANLLHLADRVDELRQEIKENKTDIRDSIQEIKVDIKTIMNDNGGQDRKIAVLEDRMGLLFKALGTSGIIIIGMVVETISSRI